MFPVLLLALVFSMCISVVVLQARVWRALLLAWHPAHMQPSQMEPQKKVHLFRRVRCRLYKCNLLHVRAPHLLFSAVHAVHRQTPMNNTHLLPRWSDDCGLLPQAIAHRRQERHMTSLISTAVRCCG